MPPTFTTQVRVYLQSDGTPLPDVSVALYDRDELSADDQLGLQRTGADGIARFAFTAQQFTDRGRGLVPLATDDGSRSPIDALPDLYVALLGATGQVVHSTRPNVIWNHPLGDVAIPLSLAQARSFGLIPTKPRGSTDDKLDAWLDRWKKRLATPGPGPGPGVDLCLTRLFLETAAGLTAPGTDAQRHAVQHLKPALKSGKLKAAHLDTLAHAARDALARLDDRHGGLRTGCSGDGGLTGVTRRLFSDGAGAPFLASFSQRDDDPDTQVGPAGKGAGFGKPFHWIKDCQTAYGNGGLSREAREDMARFMPGEPSVLVPPQVNLVDVWSPADHKTVREAWLSSGLVRLHGRTLARGWVFRDVTMRVDLDAPDALVMKADPQGKQVTAIDVRPGQKIRLRGSGFVADRATVRATRRAWATVDHGRLVPGDDRLGAGALDGLTADVHGATLGPQPTETPASFSRDELIFTWPEHATEPGLYEVFVEMPNQSVHATRASQAVPDCRLHLDQGDVRTQTLYFVILDPPAARHVRAVATRVDCDDETNPENVLFVNLADDVAYAVTGTRMTMTADATTGAPSSRADSTTTADGAHLFWNDHESWTPNLQAFPSGGPAELLGFDQLVLVTAIASEVEGDLDRAMLITALTIVVVAVVVALIVLMIVAVVAMIAVVIGLAILEVITWGAATALLPVIGGIAGILAVLAGFLVGAAFTGIMAGIGGIVAAIHGADVIADLMVGYPGVELAMRTSPVRFHQVLWFEQRGDSVDSTSGTRRVASDLDVAGGDLVEVFRAENLGGDYRLTVALQSI